MTKKKNNSKKLCVLLSEDDYNYIKDYTFKKVVSYDSQYRLSNALNEAISLLQSVAQEEIPDITFPRGKKPLTEKVSVCVKEDDFNWMNDYSSYRSLLTGECYSTSKVLREAISLLRKERPMKNVIRPEKLRNQSKI